MSAVVVISGPGGVGKGTVVRRLIELRPTLTLSRSWTTRDPRPGEDLESYTFVSEDEFRAAIDAEQFLEWDHHFLAYYGSPVPDPADPNDLVLEIDVNGAMQIAAQRPDALFVFIDTPSLDTQRERMVGRGDTEEQVERRMAAGAAERTLAEELPYVHVVNDDVDRAAQEISALIDEHHETMELEAMAPDELD